MEEANYCRSTSLSVIRELTLCRPKMLARSTLKPTLALVSSRAQVSPYAHSSSTVTKECGSSIQIKLLHWFAFATPTPSFSSCHGMCCVGTTWLAPSIRSSRTRSSTRATTFAITGLACRRLSGTCSSNFTSWRGTYMGANSYDSAAGTASRSSWPTCQPSWTPAWSVTYTFCSKIPSLQLKSA